ncbi:MYPU_1760 family metalloprotease, partial [Mycoplasmopsis anatis]
KTTKFKYDKQIQPNKVIEYIDPYTKIKFVDFAYYEDKNGPRFLLGEEGLKYLAREFKNKVPFGPEVFNLNAIHINDFNIVDDKVRGLFISNVNTIYINANFLSENGYDIETKVQNIIPTIFHEYLHYWAKTYAEVGIDSRNSELNKNTLLISSKSDEGYQTSAWNKSFVNNFKEQLGYNSTKKYPTVNNKQSLF